MVLPTDSIFNIQVRSSLKSENDFGHMDEVTCGGNALNFYAAVRLRIRRTGLLRTGNEVSAHELSGYSEIYFTYNQHDTLAACNTRCGQVFVSLVINLFLWIICLIFFGLLFNSCRLVGLGLVCK